VLPSTKPDCHEKIQVHRSTDIFALRQAETGVKVAEVCRKTGISEATFYNWKKKYGDLGTSELRRLRQLEAENQQLKKLVADLSLDKHMLQEVLKKAIRPAKRRELAQHLVEDYKVSTRRACRVCRLPANLTQSKRERFG